MIELHRAFPFKALHFVRYVEGPCSELHGHSFVVGITLAGEVDEETGMLIAPQELDEFQSLINECYDHKTLNDVPPFDYKNPTLENLAVWFYELAVSRWVFPLRVQRVQVTQEDGTYAAYMGAHYV